MSTEKKVLKLLLKNQHLFKTGLCDWLHSLFAAKIITKLEADIFQNFMKQNKPKHLFGISDTRFWYKCYDIKPRIIWIEENLALFPKSISELLTIVLHNTQFFSDCLCNLIYELVRNKIVTQSEMYRLLKYIEGHRPNKWSSIEAFIHRNDYNYWGMGKIKPRLKYLKKHIKYNDKMDL